MEYTSLSDLAKIGRSSDECVACNWSAEKQKDCSYRNPVRLFYSTGDRGVWSIGNSHILRERSTQGPNLNSVSTRLLAKKTTIPLSRTVHEWVEEDKGKYFETVERIPGETFEDACDTLSEEDISRIARQTADYLQQLRTLTSRKFESIGGKPVYSDFFFDNFEMYRPHRPFASDQEL